jgi:short-subunit dehydrogenase
MRRRERGRIAVVSALAGKAELAGMPARIAAQAGVLAYRQSLGNRSEDAAFGIAVARAGRLAGRLAARGADPRLVTVGADDAAAHIRRGIERGDDVIAFPGPLAIGLRALRLAPRWLREWPRRAVLAAAERSAEAGEEVPVPGETTQGD